MFACVVYLFAALAGLFWLIQVFDLFFRDMDYFESHTHKLVWFIALCVGNIIAAIWYFVWRGKLEGVCVEKQGGQKYNERAEK